MLPDLPCSDELGYGAAIRPRGGGDGVAQGGAGQALRPGRRTDKPHRAKRSRRRPKRTVPLSQSSRFLFNELCSAPLTRPARHSSLPPSCPGDAVPAARGRGRGGGGLRGCGQPASPALHPQRRTHTVGAKGWQVGRPGVNGAEACGVCVGGRYLGPVRFGEGVWAGIELDCYPVPGGNDGAVGGRR